jgi:hypothetical protein
MKLFLLGILLALPFVVNAQTVSGNGSITIAASLTVNTAVISGTVGWTDHPGSNQSALCPTFDSVHQCESSIETWSGGAADINNNILYWTGGGHNDSPDNSVYAFNVATGKTTVVVPPYQLPGGGYEPITYCQDANPNGQPAAMHTYGGLVYIPTNKTVMQFGGIPWCTTGNQSNAIWSLNTTTFQWTRVDGTITCVNCQGGVFSEGRFDGAAWDPVSNTEYLAGHVQGLWNYNPTTNTLACFDCTGTDVGWDYQSGVVDSGRRLFLEIGNNMINRLVIGPTGPIAGNVFSADNFNSDCSAAVNTAAPGVGYDTFTGLTVIYPGQGGTVYFYNPDTMNCTSTAFTGGPGTQDQDGMWGRFAYLPALGEFVVVNSYLNDVFTLITEVQ